jgi:hypothetical protein
MRRPTGAVKGRKKKVVAPLGSKRLPGPTDAHYWPLRSLFTQVRFNTGRLCVRWSVYRRPEKDNV